MSWSPILMNTFFSSLRDLVRPDGTTVRLDDAEGAAFGFDKVFNASTEQHEVFAEVKAQREGREGD